MCYIFIVTIFCVFVCLFVVFVSRTREMVNDPLPMNAEKTN